MGHVTAAWTPHWGRRCSVPAVASLARPKEENLVVGLEGPQGTRPAEGAVGGLARPPLAPGDTATWS